MVNKRRRKKLLFKRKRTLDPDAVIDYKEYDQLKRFVTDRGKIIPRRISGATASQQRSITREIKRARYLALLPFSVAHRQEKNMVIEAALTMASVAARSDRRPARQESSSPSGGDSLTSASSARESSAEQGDS